MIIISYKIIPFVMSDIWSEILHLEIDLFRIAPSSLVGKDNFRDISGASIIIKDGTFVCNWINQALSCYVGMIICTYLCSSLCLSCWKMLTCSTYVHDFIL